MADLPYEEIDGLCAVPEAMLTPMGDNRAGTHSVGDEVRLPDGRTGRVVGFYRRPEPIGNLILVKVKDGEAPYPAEAAVSPVM